MITRSSLIAGLMMMMLLLATGGCGLGKLTVQRQYYVLETQRSVEQARAATPVAATLTVLPFGVSPAWDSDSLIVIHPGGRLSRDYYNLFLAGPADMIADQTRRWLVASGLYESVTASHSQIRGDYCLEAIVGRLGVDLTDARSPQAVMDIEFYLIQQREQGKAVTPAPVFYQSYSSWTAARNMTTTEVIAALDRCLAEILTQLEADLPAALSK